MSVAVARFVGGPCAGQTAPATPQPFRDCSGATYGLLEDGNYHFLGSTADAVGPDALGTRGPRGWADLQRAVNVSLPTGTSRAKALTRAAHRKLMQRRRIG